MAASESDHHLLENDSVAQMVFNQGCILDCNQACLTLFEADAKDEILGLHPSQLSPEYQVSGAQSSVMTNQFLTQCFERGRSDFEWLHTTVKGGLFLCHVQLRLIPDKGIVAKILHPRVHLAEGRSPLGAESSEFELEYNLDAAFQEGFNLLNQHKRAIDVSAIVSKTDAEGTITYVNDMFCRVSGYSRGELLGNNHNVVNHPGMLREVFHELWATIKSGKVWNGVILSRSKAGGSYYVSTTISPIFDSNREIKEYIAISHDITDVYEKDQIIQVQTTDVDTGLPNRVLFNDDLKRKPSVWVASFFFPEIENVQQIYSDTEYKCFMQKLAAMLLDHAQGMGKVYRTSDSYFALIGEEGWEKDKFLACCEEIVANAHGQPISVGEAEIYLAIKVGIAENHNYEKTYGHACLALKSACEEQENLGVYDQGTREYEKLNDAIFWAGKLRNAVPKGNIKIYGQGIFYPSGERYSTEVLMRYQTVDECVSPIVFLDYAKSAGLYSSLSHEIIKQSLSYFKQHGGRFSINLDKEDIFNKATRTILIDFIKAYECGSQLTVELVESSGVDFSEKTVDKFLTKLRSMGCKIAIDDFGSGYSNFNYLATMHPDLVKIDGSLIRDILHNKKHYQIVLSIVSLCKSLEIPVVAEFAAEKEIVDLLIEVGVDYFQGYYFEKPTLLE